MNTFRDGDGQMWAVNPAKIVCDFCSGVPVRWRYPARNFQVGYTFKGHQVQNNSHGDWASCDECHKLIQASEREALAERSFESFPVPKAQIPSHIQAEVKGHIRTMQDTFWSAREGAPAPVEISEERS